MIFGPKDTIPVSERFIVTISDPKDSSVLTPTISVPAEPISATPSVVSGHGIVNEATKMGALMKGVQDAAVATAQAFRYGPCDTDNVRSIFKACQQVSNKNLLRDVERLCKLDPKYVNVRAASMQQLATDGMTPLHAAAFWGNIEMVEFLLKGVKVSQEQHSRVQQSATSHRQSVGCMMSPKELYTATHSRNTKAISSLLKGFWFQSEPEVQVNEKREKCDESINLEGLDELVDVVDSEKNTKISRGVELPVHVGRDMSQSSDFADCSVVVSADPWVVDLQGKTALHHAVAAHRVDVCRVLREAMKRRGPRLYDLYGRRRVNGLNPVGFTSPSTAHPSKAQCQEAGSESEGVDPVGWNAPVDLTGTTPLGLIAGKGYTQGFRPGDRSNEASLEQELFSPGDASVLPRTPYFHRSGAVTTPSNKKGRKDNSFCEHTLESSVLNGTNPHADLSEGKVSPSHQLEDAIERNSFVYAYSEAGGWRSHMEDRVVICAPLIPSESNRALRDASLSREHLISELDMTDWSLFAVLDGHGGDFASTFISEILPGLLIRNAVDLLNEISKDKKVDESSFSEIADAFFKKLWTQTLMQADDELSLQNRMQVCTTTKGILSMLDKSGTTCVACLVTPSYVAVANVGDSRAVLGFRGAAEKSTVVDAIAMSEDHKPQLPFEKERIERAGCRWSVIVVFIFCINLSLDAFLSVSRISPESNGYEVKTPISKEILRMSRSLGDFYLKNCRAETGERFAPYDQAVIALPDVTVRKRSEKCVSYENFA